MSKSSSCWVSSLSILALVGACTSTGQQSDGPTSATKATITVSSVQMFEDCPDSEAETAAEAKLERARPAKPDEMEAAEYDSESKPDPAGAYGGDSYASFCEQSTIQLALEASGRGSVPVQIKAVRLLSSGKPVGALATRKPKIWTGSGYEAWDQTLGPGEATQASYKLGQPDWAAVETAIGRHTYGVMFTLELDVVVDGVVQTVRSPEFPREEAHMVET